MRKVSVESISVFLSGLDYIFCKTFSVNIIKRASKHSWAEVIYIKSFFENTEESGKFSVSLKF